MGWNLILQIRQMKKIRNSKNISWQVSTTWIYYASSQRGVAQFGRAQRSGRWGRKFESCRLDCGQLVKRLRRRPLTAQTRVRFPDWSWQKLFSLKSFLFLLYKSPDGKHVDGHACMHRYISICYYIDFICFAYVAQLVAQLIRNE